ncbi:MAG: DUF58 domain-containing protein [Verrucomicrobiae bacterium]|nr:DUF58 domain-containing protein [Verrucomicrobiae bacterium]NNJ85984.1 DUF58 domain-containing protein [Akkermansiaceae bacterium]
MAASQPSPLFQRVIYRIYHRNSAIAHFLTHRVRPAGILLVVLIPASWMLMPLHSLGPIFQVRGMLFVLLGISCLWALSRRARVRVSRELPRLATAGEKLDYKVSVRNTGGRSLAGANLLDMAPDNRPSLQQFSRSREPGEETRNLFDRVFGYYRWEWLQKTLTLFTNKPSDPVPHLRPGEEANLTLSLTPTKRGVIILKDLRLCLPDPFGVFQRCRATRSTRDKLIVLPSRYRLPLLDLPGNARFQLGGEAASSTIGQSGDFTGVREYRPGDPLRHIDWKSWARTGKPIVKEYEDVFFPRYGLVLDTFAPAEQADLFEHAVSVAASYAATIDTRETLLDLMFIHDEAFVFSAGRGEERIEKMLEILAGVSCEPTTNFDALQKLVLRYQDDFTACICIFTGWCEQRRDTVSKLHRSGVELKIISICRSMKEAELVHQRHPSPVPVQWLRSDSIQEDLFMNNH